MRVRVYVKPIPQSPKDGPECRQCIMTEKIMTDKGIDYEPIIMTDEVVSDLKALGYMSAPVVLVGDHEVFGWAGFQPALINELVEQIKQSQAAT